MLLVKINEYKYQVLKIGQKNSVTLPFEGQTQIAIYESTEQSTKNYVNIDSVEASIKQYVEIDVSGHDDYLLALDLYIDEDGNCSTRKFEMQATTDKIIKAQNSEDIKEKSIDDVLERLKISENEKIKALDLQILLTSNAKEKEQVQNYRDYLKSGDIKRKLLAKMRGGIPSLNETLMTKYNTLICFLPEIEELLVNTEITQAEKELIVDYIYVSRYKVLKFEKLFLKEKPVSSDNREMTIKFISNAKKLLVVLESNPTKIMKCLDFIASSLNAVTKMTKNKYFYEDIIRHCNQQIIAKQEEVNALIAADFDIIETIVKGEEQ